MSAREHLSAIIRAGLAAVDPREAVRRALRLDGGRIQVGDAEPLEVPGRIWLVGAGKAAAGMARGALEVLGARVAGGCIAVPHAQAPALPGVDVWEAGHPLPDAHGMAAAAEALHLVRGARPGDLVLCLLSGGASALWPAPPEGVSLGELRALTEALLRAGAPIQEVNVVRKHLSRMAGGGLARAAGEARVATLAISDVIGAPPDAIGSGPTVPDRSTYTDALAVLGRRGVEAPASVLHHLQRGAAGEVPETLKAGEAAATATFYVVARLRDALEAAAGEAERLGYRARVLSEELAGEAGDVAPQLAREALRARDAGEAPCALLWGGETTVTVRGDGRGGRNQEVALAAARVLQQEPGVTMAAVGTDGIDGPTDAAGAVVDGETVERGRAAGLDPATTLARNDSYTFLDAAGDLLITGPTGTNVGDLVVALVDRG